MIVDKCHVACQVCTDATNVCSQCAVGYKRSGTVCELNCLPLYGEVTATPTVCVLCDVLCQACQETSTNCSQCTTLAPNEAFLNGNTCLVTCLSYSYENYATHECTACPDNNNCLDCDTSTPDICYDCDPDSYWLDFLCYNVCPENYFIDVRNCTLCFSLCLECTGFPGPCSKCVDGFYIYNQECGVCPAGFFGFEPTGVCLDCALNCTTATIDTYQTAEGSILSDICFSQPVDFSTFPY